MMCAKAPETMFRLDGKRVFITGGGGGIGQAAARMFAAFGAHVVVLDRDAAAAEAVCRDVREAGGTAMAAALEKKGYDHQFVFGEGTHSARHGTMLFPEAMRWMWRDYPKD